MKPRDLDEPTSPHTQTRSLGWTGYQLTVKELRSWLDQIPNQAILEIRTTEATNSIHAIWEVAP